MEIREKAISEIKQLNADKLITLYEIILSLKKTDSLVRQEKKSLAYLKVRELLNPINGALADDIISMREDRI